jgi:hypothetical protein
LDHLGELRIADEFALIEEEPDAVESTARLGGTKGAVKDGEDLARVGVGDHLLNGIIDVWGGNSAVVGLEVGGEDLVQGLEGVPSGVDLGAAHDLATDGGGEADKDADDAHDDEEFDECEGRASVRG